MTFVHSSQKPTETLEEWSQRLDKNEIRVGRYGAKVSFESYLEQWCVDTRKGAFLTALRKVKNPSKNGQIPEIRNRATFDQWKNNYFENFRQIQREDECFRELQIRNGYSRARQQRRTTPSNQKKEGKHSSNNSNRSANRSKRHNKPKLDAGNLNRDGPGYNTARNPHSALATNTITMHPTVNDRPKVKCFNCNIHGHFASKCPEPKRSRKQRLLQLKASTATITGDSTVPVTNQDDFLIFE